ncbi:hypothetical protein GGR51DRAFT_180737 [Nemania sp. FL0031]|nr:hypothetical protein GGR51DRAFT_180737 [Nemania sp. FL0031]
MSYWTVLLRSLVCRCLAGVPFRCRALWRCGPSMLRHESDRKLENVRCEISHNTSHWKSITGPPLYHYPIIPLKPPSAPCITI